MTQPIELVLFDIGGVLGSNGWDREQRAAAIETFGLNEADFQYRHEETVGALESGYMTLDEYLDVTVFCEARNCSREEFKEFMFAQSVPWPDSIAVARDLATARRATVRAASSRRSCSRRASRGRTASRWRAISRRPAFGWRR